MKNASSSRSTAYGRHASARASSFIKSNRWRICILLLSLFCVTCNAQTTESIEVNRNDITVYSALPSDTVGPYLTAFKAEHPEIRVKLVNAVTLDLVARLLAEQKNPKADVVWGLAVSSMLTLEWNYLLTMYTPTGTDRIDPLFLDSKLPPQWVGITARSIALCANQAELRKQNLPLPTSWQDLVNPIYQGKLLILSPGQTSVGYLLISTILQMYGENEGWEYLAQLQQNVGGVYANNARNVCESVSKGDYLIGLTYDYRAYYPDNPNMALIFPKEGAGWELEANGLVRREYIKKSAKTFLDWAISDSAMQQYAKDRMIIAATLDEKTLQGTKAKDISSYLFNDLDIPWIAANRERVQEEWMKLYGEASKLIDTS